MGSCWRATGLDDVRGWSFKARGLSSKRSPQTPERRMRCAGRGARGAADLRPLRIGLAGAATG